MKDYLVCLKKLEWRVEIGVSVGGLPRDVLRVLGTSVVHYELIRRGMCGCVRDHVRTCDHVCTEKGEEMMESKSVFVFVCVLCVWVGGRKGLACSSRRQTLPGHYLWRAWHRHLQLPDACSSIEAPRLTSTHTLSGLFEQPMGPTVLRTWYGIYKKIFVNGGQLSLMGLSMLLFPTLYDIWEEGWNCKPGVLNVRRCMP